MNNFDDVSKTFAARLSPVAMAVALIATGSITPALAQDADAASDDEKFEAITVTATKRPQVYTKCQLPSVHLMATN